MRVAARVIGLRRRAHLIQGLPWPYSLLLNPGSRIPSLFLEDLRKCVTGTARTIRESAVGLAGAFGLCNVAERHETDAPDEVAGGRDGHDDPKRAEADGGAKENPQE